MENPLSQSHRAYLRECARRLEETARVRPLTEGEKEALAELYCRIDAEE